ncbi:hypothetical protein MKX01_000844 [Papaver californicum]|nr:hypothetical protein MKX01_000844 [Papaver californicum]
MAMSTWNRLLRSRYHHHLSRSISTATTTVSDPFGLLPLIPQRRVVVTLQTFEQLTSKVAAIVPCGSNFGEFNDETWMNSKDHRSMARFVAYALCSTDEALRDANWMPTEMEKKERTGVSIGAGTGCISDILDAAKMICEKFGDSDVMVAGGTESSIDALSIAGFYRSRALTTKYNSVPQEASRPFDWGRDGFVIAEGSGVMVLEELEHAQKRGARIYAEVRGYGMSGDAYHITQPHSDGRGAILAMSRALKQSGLHPHEVDYVNAHATSTPLGDAIEANAIKSMFPKHTSGALALSSTKGATGHLLGAAGAVEAIFEVLATYHGTAPLTLNLQQPDPVFQDGFMPLSRSKEMQIRAAMSNSFGFGGTNASPLAKAHVI